MSEIPEDLNIVICIRLFDFKSCVIEKILLIVIYKYKENSFEINLLIFKKIPRKQTLDNKYDNFSATNKTNIIKMILIPKLKFTFRKLVKRSSEIQIIFMIFLY